MAESDKAPMSAGLQPPDVHPGPPPAAPAKHGVIWLALAVVILLGLAVLLVLPKMVSDTPDEPGTAVAEQTVVGTPQAGGEPAEDSRRIAEQATQDFLHLRARLELANAPAWGEPEWSQALEGSARGNELFGQRQFSMAAEALTTSSELLLSLESTSGQRLQNALNSGRQALQLDDGAAAEAFFETALSIEADNEIALTGLAQARVRSDLLGLMAAGELALSNNDLPGAQARARPGHHPPRYQARQHYAHAGRAGEAVGLRHRQAVLDRGDDAGRRADRHGQLHVARAGGWRARQ